jgi:hypothetical protein
MVARLREAGLVVWYIRADNEVQPVPLSMICFIQTD